MVEVYFLHVVVDVLLLLLFEVVVAGFVEDLVSPVVGVVFGMVVVANVVDLTPTFVVSVLLMKEIVLLLVVVGVVVDVCFLHVLVEMLLVL